MTRAIPPPSEREALTSQPTGEERNAHGRQGLWDVAPYAAPGARTTYVDGRPDGAFFWPAGGSAKGWIEGVLRPVDGPSDSLASPSALGANGAPMHRVGPSRAETFRTFGPGGTCLREARHDALGQREQVRQWDASGILLEEAVYIAGVPHGTWGRARGKSWDEVSVVDGRVVLTAEDATSIGAKLSKTARDFADAEKLEQAIAREMGHDDLRGPFVAALVRAGTLDPLLSHGVLLTLSARPGLALVDLDAILDDARPYPAAPALCHLPGWPLAVDRLVARAAYERAPTEWAERARALADGNRRIGLLFFARRFGAELTAEETEEVGLAMLDSVSQWSLQTIAIPGPRIDGLTLAPFSGKTRDAITAAFGL